MLIIVLHYFLEILLTLHFHDVLKLEAKVIFLFHPTLRYMGGLPQEVVKVSMQLTYLCYDLHIYADVLFQLVGTDVTREY